MEIIIGFFIGFCFGFLALIFTTKAVKFLFGRDLTLGEQAAVCILTYLFIVGLAHQSNATVFNPKYKIAIIDTGYDINQIRNHTKLKLCPTGHFDFTTGQDKIGYVENHGTSVATIIADKLKNVDYCAVIFTVSAHIPPTDVVEALRMAEAENVLAVNASYESNYRFKNEEKAFIEFGKQGKKIFVAAGNNAKNLDVQCNEFPACFNVPNMVVVGAMKDDLSKKLPESNRGSKVDLWFNGDDVLNLRASATSFATPRALSYYILGLDHQ